MLKVAFLLLGLMWSVLNSAGSATAQSSTFEQLKAQYLAHWHAKRFNDAAAIGPALEAAARAKFGTEHPSYGQVIYSFGSLESDRGNYAAAETHMLAALAITERVRGPRHAEVSNILSDLAVLYDRTDRLKEAEAAYRRSQAIDAVTLPRNNPAAIGSIGNFAILLGRQARFGEAEDLLRQALAAAEKASDRRTEITARLIGTLGSNYLRQRRFAEAEPLLARSLELTETLNDPTQTKVALAMVNLANARSKLGRREDAIALLTRALAIKERVYGAEHPDLVVALNNLGTEHVELKQFALAEQLFRRALNIAEERFGPRHSSVANPLQNLGDAMSKTDRYAEAEVFLARAYDINRNARGPIDPLTITTQFTRANVAASRKDLAASLRFSREATGAIVTRARAVDSARGTEASPIVQQRFVFEGALRHLASAAVARTEPSDSLGREAFVTAQWPAQSHAGAAIQQMAARFAEGDSPLAALVRESQDLDTRWLATEARFKAALEGGAAKASSVQGDGKLAQVRSELAEIEQRQGALRNRLASEFPGYTTLTRPDPLSVENAQRQLGPDEALVFLYVGKDQTTVWAVTRADFAWHTLAVTQSALAEQVSHLRAGLEANPSDVGQASNPPPLFEPRAAHALFKSLLGPVDHVIAKAQHLLVVPTGPLTSLPFQVLVTAEPPPGSILRTELHRYRDVAWLAKRQASSVLPAVASLAALRSLPAGSPAPEPLVGFADPIFQVAPAAPKVQAARNANAASRPKAVAKTGEPPAPSRATTGPEGRRTVRAYASFFRGANTNLSALRQSLAQLPETADELRAVADRLGAGSAHLLLGAAATETIVKNLDLSRFRVVYFATHGLVAGELDGYGEPSLALTIPDVATAIDDGLLTASEIATLKMRADWVVLSACNTAAGDGAGADALSGLARSFFYAGARAMLVTHWAVDSQAAVALTTNTFAELEKVAGIGRAEALRRSMLSLIQDVSEPLNAYPGLWAPFVVVGEGGRRSNR